mgnify:CR=1 FL=1
MTSLKKLLPETFKYYGPLNSPAWSTEGEISDSLFVGSCLDEIRRLQTFNSTQEHFDWVLAFSKTVLQDVIKLKSDAQYQDNLVIINFIQFCVTLEPLHVLASQKKLQEGYDWIAFSFCDDLSSNQRKEFEIDRLIQYITIPLDESNEICNPELIATWVGDFYYICRALGAIPHVANEIYIWSSFWVFYTLDLGGIEGFIWSASCMACWGANNQDNRTYQLVQVFEKLISDDKVSDRVKLGILICLSTTVSFYSSRPSHDWAKIALNKYFMHCEGHQKLHLLLDSCPETEVHTIQQNFESILFEINQDRTEVIELTKNPVELIQALDRLSEMITPFIGKCILLKAGDIATEILKSWYQVEPHKGVNSEELLIVFPNHNDSLRYSFGKKSLISPRDLSSLYTDLIKTLNKFLGISHSIRQAPDLDIHAPTKHRFGIPDETKSKDMEKLLVKFYALEKLKAFICKNGEPISSYICLPSHQHSFQYLCKKYIKQCWPLSASLESPLQDRVVTNVCIWCGAGSITEDIELNAVKLVLEKQQISIDCFSSDETTFDKFKSIYESNKYDVIWVMSHGEFDHFRPGSVSINISEDKAISLDEILHFSCPKSNKRRLLFLNVCDGATHSNVGGIAKLGFAPALSSQNQCVISHLWPVNPIVAATFGAMYAVNIAKGMSFFSAFQETLNHINSTKDDVVNRINTCVNDELGERINNKDIDFELMIHSGSATFFQ